MFRMPPASPDAPPTSVAELCTRLRSTFEEHLRSDGRIPLNVRNERLCQLLTDARFAQHEWDEYVHFDERRYQRVLLAFDEHFSLVLNCWHRQQATPLHRHDDRDAWIRVVAGELTLTHYAADGEPPEPTLSDALSPTSGATYYSRDAIGLHALANVSEKSGAVSLHLYTPALVNLQCASEAAAAAAANGDAPSLPNNEVPVVYCAKALTTPHACETLLARARAASKVFGSFASFVGALKRCMEQKQLGGVAALVEQYQFSESEWRSYMQPSSRAARTLVGLGDNFSVVMRFWCATLAQWRALAHRNAMRKRVSQGRRPGQLAAHARLGGVLGQGARRPRREYSLRARKAAA